MPAVARLWLNSGSPAMCARTLDEVGLRPYQYVKVGPALAAVIEGFSLRRFADAGALPVLELPARTDLFLEFYLAEPYRVRQSGATQVAPTIALVAPHTRPGTELLIGGHVDTFTVHFRPTGCHRLYGCDLPALRDRAVPASDVLGRGLWRLRAVLQRTPGFAARVAVAQAHFEDALSRSRPADAFDLAADRLASDLAPVRVSQLARQIGCSERQLSRVLTRRTGVAPKLYSRMVRFQTLLDAHAQQPGLPLVQLAQGAHYFDQAHFARDCREFTARAPREFLSRWTPRDRIGC